jgi:hypothetical protein
LVAIALLWYLKYWLRAGICEDQLSVGSVFMDFETADIDINPGSDGHVRLSAVPFHFNSGDRSFYTGALRPWIFLPASNGKAQH